jgi:hypothetical protein
VSTVSSSFAVLQRALRKNRQSLPFNAMHRSRKALDKNCQHGLIEAPSLQMIQLYWNGSMQGARAGRTRLITP